jgi:hypothetical protein
VDNIGVLIFFALIGSVICAKARSAGGAVLFGGVALAMFISTPAGDGLPGALSEFLSTINDASTPALTENGEADQDAEPVG